MGLKISFRSLNEFPYQIVDYSNQDFENEVYLIP